MIEVSNLSKIYRSGEDTLYAVNDVSFEVEKGEFLMIMGRSGCGKSTLLNILGLIDSFDTGSYRLNGTDIKTASRDQLSKLRLAKIGYIYQAYNLIDELNILDNIELVQGYAGVPAKARRKRAQALLNQVGLTEKAKLYPQQLSGGQQQRVAIARAISNHPEIILADEPTGNLDYATGMQVMALLKELNAAGITIIMVTHDHDLSNYATRIVQMADGEISTL